MCYVHPECNVVIKKQSKGHSQYNFNGVRASLALHTWNLIFWALPRVWSRNVPRFSRKAKLIVTCARVSDWFMSPIIEFHLDPRIVIEIQSMCGMTLIIEKIDIAFREIKRKMCLGALALFYIINFCSRPSERWFFACTHKENPMIYSGKNNAAPLAPRGS